MSQEFQKMSILLNGELAITAEVDQPTFEGLVLALIYSQKKNLGVKDFKVILPVLPKEKSGLNEESFSA